MSDIKTLEGWHASDYHDFLDYVQPGDQVDQAIYDYMLGVVPPAYQGWWGFLMGEPANSDSKGRQLYMAFHDRGGHYFYNGLVTLEEVTK